MTARSVAPPVTSSKRNSTDRGATEQARFAHAALPADSSPCLIRSYTPICLPLRSVGAQMKVTVERAALLKSLGHVHRVVERRNTIPILANVLVRADHSRLAFKATDLDLEVTESIAAEIS